MSKALKLAVASTQILSSSLRKSAQSVKNAKFGQQSAINSCASNSTSCRPCSTSTSRTLPLTAVTGTSTSSTCSASKFLSSQPKLLLNRLLPSSNATRTHSANYSSEVDKEISSFLEKEIQYESSRAASSLPKVPGFEIVTDGADVTLTKTIGKEKIVVRLSVNGAVDSVLMDGAEDKQDEPPQMLCRPPFEVEISKGGNEVLALQCTFPSIEETYENTEQFGKGEQATEEIDDQFEIQEVALHKGEWKDATFAVPAGTMDAELFDLLMDLLDERGINDEFISQLVEYCTAYENQMYIQFLNGLKTFSQ